MIIDKKQDEYYKSTSNFFGNAGSHDLPSLFWSWPGIYKSWERQIPNASGQLQPSWKAPVKILACRRSALQILWIGIVAKNLLTSQRTPSSLLRLTQRKGQNSGVVAFIQTELGQKKHRTVELFWGIS